MEHLLCPHAVSKNFADPKTIRPLGRCMRPHLHVLLRISKKKKNVSGQVDIFCIFAACTISPQYLTDLYGPGLNACAEDTKYSHPARSTLTGGPLPLTPAVARRRPRPRLPHQAKTSLFSSNPATMKP